ncbi:MAG: hypothetical protein QOH36_1446 [Actinomycetota bacterium]|jgi:hypothetical protein|nr:hypothetical protein [Actinomycetota bacterium]MEA2973018.1 hypothetical protein [Actinomycetota bacterium]
MAGRENAGARKARRRRVQGAALSGGALVAGQLAGAVPAHAVGIVVNSLLDNGDGANTTLREAIEQSNADTGVTDAITFSVTGTINLDPSLGPLRIHDDVTITGPGPTAAAITVQADGTHQVFYVYSLAEDIAVTISGLTVTGGSAGGSSGGGGVYVFDETLTLDDMVITGNHSEEGGGGVDAEEATLTITDSVISENDTDFRGGGVLTNASQLTIEGTTFIHNSATDVLDGVGGGLAVRGEDGDVTITGSLFENNQAAFAAGIGLYAESTAVAITATTLTSNDAIGSAGGLGMLMANDDAADLVTVTDSTFSGNTAGYGGGGIVFYGLYDAGSRLVIERSTISGNEGAEGGGVGIINSFGGGDAYDVVHSVTISDSTISGNRALGIVDRVRGFGGGVLVGLYDSSGGDTLLVAIDNSTIAGNTATEAGGGLVEDFFNSAVIDLNHTIVGDNSVVDGDGPDVAGSISAEWSVFESTSGAAISGANNITADPQLGPLANNGGPTQTHMISPTSPAFDSGNPAFGATPAVDQRGRPRISGQRIDRGAVERQTSLPAVVKSSVNWNLRDRLSTGPANLPTFTMGTTPLVPVMGDWDGDGDKTPGFFKGGVFTLSNNLDGTGPFVTFTFGHVNGFPVAGNWDGDADDEVAVFRLGQWQVRPNTNTGAVTGTTVTFGAGTWPATVPVAGDWNGDGTDGIGYYLGNGAGVGTWSLRNTASSGPVEIGPFAYEPGAPAAGYPVVGDWDGDGFDTFGVKAGVTWTVSNTHAPNAPVTAYSFDFSTATPAQDLPLVWRYGTGP